MSVPANACFPHSYQFASQHTPLHQPHHQTPTPTEHNNRSTTQIRRRVQRPHSACKQHSHTSTSTRLHLCTAPSSSSPRSTMGGTTTYALSEEAYLTVLLHAAKYPSCTVCGVLLGQSVGGAVTVTKAIPLFHLSMLLAPAVDTALSQAEVYAQQNLQQLVGYYHGEARMNAQDIHPVAKRIADRIAERHPDAFVLALNNHKLKAFSREGSTDPPFELLLRESSAAPGRWKRVAGGGPGSSALWLSGGSDWEQLRARFLNMHAKGQHGQLADFDEHLDDVSKDYTNPQLFGAAATGLLTR